MFNIRKLERKLPINGYLHGLFNWFYLYQRNQVLVSD